MKRFQIRPTSAERSDRIRPHKRAIAGRRRAHRLLVIDPLEARQLFSGGTSAAALVPPTDLKVTIGYREAPDGGTDRAHISWTDTNSSENGYRVESSIDGVNNWVVIGA